VGQQSASARIADADLRFLENLARQAIDEGAWTTLGGDTVRLLVKAGSWYEACCQVIGNETARLLFLIPGAQDLLALHRSGMAEPPDGTLFAEFRDGSANFSEITPQGWRPIGRFQSQLLALALSAVTALVTAPAGEAHGDVALPGGVRGRFRAWRFPADPNGPQMLMGMPRFDLYGEDDWTLSMLTLDWPQYEMLRGRAEHRQFVAEPFEDRGAPIHLLVISGPRAGLPETARKLHEADVRGITFGEMNGVLAMLAGGLKESYVLMEANEERETVQGWWYGVKASGGAHAIMLTDDAPNLKLDGPWTPSSVAAVFEFGRQGEGAEGATPNAD
jgi:hypothetical protein